MQEEVENRTLTLVVNGTKFTGRLFKAAICKYLAHRKEKKLNKQRSRDAPVKPQGKQTVKQLIGQNQGVSNIEITDANIGLFKPCAKKYGVDFTLRKDATTQPPHYIVIFKAKDADNMEQAFKEFTAKKLQREERPSIRKNIAASKEKAAARNADRAKEKFKERGLSR